MTTTLSRAQDIHIVGAREHNLKNVEVRLPRHALTVVTGVSGSGKSTLAMDTLYAEGYRRYLESVSTYARYFLERLPRPQVDAVHGLSPAVSLSPRSSARTARSTVGTSTEVLDYLRVFFARVGQVCCDGCGARITVWTVAEVVRRWREAPVRLLVTFPLAVTGRAAEQVRALAARGYTRVVVDGSVRELLQGAPPDRSWDVLQDRLASGGSDRLVESLEAAFREGHGRAAIHPEGEAAARYRLGRVCPACDVSLPEPAPHHFSFTNPAGACPACEGFGFALEFDVAKIIPDPARALDDGAIAPWAGRWRNWFARKLAGSPRGARIARNRPWRELPEDDREFLLRGDGRFPGVLGFLERLERKSYKSGARFLVKRYQNPVLCTTCGGTRLGPAGRRVRLDGETLPEWCDRSVGDVRARLRTLPLDAAEEARVGPLRDELHHRLGVLEKVGLTYLTLSRLTRTLSGGESQRIEIAQALGARLTDALYVLDEPTVGLHPEESARLLEVLRDLVEIGNTVVVVEHDLDVLAAADWMIDMGPGSGRAGGAVVYAGPPSERVHGAPSPTADLLRDRRPPPREPLRDPRGWIRLRDARLHNLRHLDVDLPWGLLLGVCGMSGSGKSTLIAETLVPLLERLDPASTSHARSASFPGGTLLVEAPCRGVRVVDQSPLARSARSVPASYVGAWDGIRALYASLPESRRLGLRPGSFSFNVAGGRCETCRGDGVVTVDMDFMADLELPCEACGGSRFASFVCGPRYHGRSIVDVLGLTVDEAMILFARHPAIGRSLSVLSRVGLGYLTLGQPVPTLSGGEAQRLKLARQLATGARDLLFVLDEPTVGLHGAEVRRLLALLADLVRAGNTVIVIEHHVDVLAACDWLLELGPQGGEQGGQVIAAGPPEVVARRPESRIAPYLAPRLASGRRPGDLLLVAE